MLFAFSLGGLLGERALAFAMESEQIAQIFAHFGVYNFVRRHHTLGTTPAVTIGLEEKPWSLEQVVEMTSEYQSQNPVSNVHH